jgi:hypothetical protein
MPNLEVPAVLVAAALLIAAPVARAGEQALSPPRSQQPDPLLAHLLTEANERNPDIQAAASAVAAGRQRPTQARSLSRSKSGHRLQERRLVPALGLDDGQLARVNGRPEPPFSGEAVPARPVGGAGRCASRTTPGTDAAQRHGRGAPRLLRPARAGRGADVRKRVAAPMVGSLATSIADGATRVSGHPLVVEAGEIDSIPRISRRASAFTA